MHADRRKKRLFLHIGTEKTGSTSIQAAFSTNRERLAQVGMFYPRSPGKQNHVGLALYASSDPRSLNLRRSVGLADETEYQAYKASFRENFLQEIEANPCPTVCLSNEHVSSRVLALKDIERLAELLGAAADSVKVIVYLRPQHELVASAYSTSITAGSTEALLLPEGDRNPYYNYERLLSPWAEVFGQQNVMVRIYDREDFPEGDVVRDFLAALDVRIPPGFEFPTDRNPALDQKALQFLRLFNAHVPRFVDDKDNPDRGDIMGALQSLSRGPAVVLRESDALQVLALFETSNASVARRFLGRPDGVLFRRLRVANRAVEPLTAEDAVALASALWCRKQRQLVQCSGLLHEFQRAGGYVPDSR
jgi:hypothetical protein